MARMNEGGHGGRVFLEPLIEELGDFLAEIGSVAEVSTGAYRAGVATDIV
jgi:hypothetical protein